MKMVSYQIENTNNKKTYFKKNPEILELKSVTEMKNSLKQLNSRYEQEGERISKI